VTGGSETSQAAAVGTRQRCSWLSPKEEPVRWVRSLWSRHAFEQGIGDVALAVKAEDAPVGRGGSARGPFARIDSVITLPKQRRPGKHPCLSPRCRRPTLLRSLPLPQRLRLGPERPAGVRRLPPLGCRAAPTGQAGWAGAGPPSRSSTGSEVAEATWPRAANRTSWPLPAEPSLPCLGGCYRASAAGTRTCPALRVILRTGPHPGGVAQKGSRHGSNQGCVGLRFLCTFLCKALTPPQRGCSLLPLDSQPGQVHGVVNLFCPCGAWSWGKRFTLS
jgi:hypothetical protein